MPPGTLVHPELDLPLEELLVLGGDDRMRPDPATGLNNYGCAPYPRPEVLALGSCTASSPSQPAFEAAEKAREILLEACRAGTLAEAAQAMYSAIRREVAELLALHRAPGSQVILMPSGTDAEYLATLLALGDRSTPLCNIVSGPSEVGSGTTLAAGGHHFNAQVPAGGQRVRGEAIDEAIARLVRVETIVLRRDDGLMREPEEIDAEAERLANAALDDASRVLVHIVAHSKTGVHAPNLDAVDRIRARAPDRVDVIIDAAQGRVSRRGLGNVLRQGDMLLFTGSKFYGGPPFAGALLVPPGIDPHARGVAPLPAGLGDFVSADALPPEWAAMRPGLPTTPNLGLLIRWSAALCEMRRYYASNDARRYRVLRHFESQVPLRLGRSERIELHSVSPPVLEPDAVRVLESKTTVFPFYARRPDGQRVSFAGLQLLHRWLNVDASELLDASASKGDRHAAPRCFHLGQPVALGPPASRDPAVLRVALGAPLLADLAEGPRYGDTLDQRLAHFDEELDTLKAKIELLVRVLNLPGAS